MVAWTVFRPSRTQAVLVVAATEPERVEAALRPHYGRALCVVRSRWTPEQVTAVRESLRAGMRTWNVYTFGDTATGDGQLLVTAKAVRVVPALASWAAGVPAGLLHVNTWLAPTAG